ncbi:MAG: adaptor protein MecA, partial [Clostridia bacterium]|nr:adaptor protein MecA [Clostridia bacterium]
RVGDNSSKIPKTKNKKGRYKKSFDISPLVFKFYDFEVLVSACKRVENMYAGISRLYKMDGEYYLVMDAVYEKVALNTEVLLCEYGKKVLNSNVAEGRLDEYGDLLISDTAIADISANF